MNSLVAYIIGQRALFLGKFIGDGSLPCEHETFFIPLPKDNKPYKEIPFPKDEVLFAKRMLYEVDFAAMHRWSEDVDSALQGSEIGGVYLDAETKISQEDLDKFMGTSPIVDKGSPKWDLINTNKTGNE